MSEELIKQFFEAAKSNNINKVVECIQSGVDVDTQDKSNYGRTVLHVAAYGGYNDLMKNFIEKYNADINQEDDIGVLPLHISADKMNFEMTKYLVNKGSDFKEDVEHLLNNKQ